MKRFSGPDVPCVVCGKRVVRRYDRHRYCSLRCWSADPANARYCRDVLARPRPK